MPAPHIPARPAASAAPQGRPAAQGQDGIALILVLWVLTLLTVMALGMTAAQRTEIALTDNLVSEARFRALADAAIAYTALSFLAPPPEAEAGLGGAGELGAWAAGEAPPAPWLPNGMPRDWGLAGESVRISVFNESSRIALNQADSRLLGALLAALGLPEEEAPELADAIVDFRDEDDLKQLNGAEDDDYESAGRPLGAKDAPFAAVEELQQVLGMTRELYRRLAPELTVDIDSAQPEMEFASPAVLAATQGIELEEAMRQVQERDNPDLLGGAAPSAVNRGGPLYRVRVEEQTGDGKGRSMEALLELAAGQQPPFRMRWRRYGLIGAPPPAASPPDAW